MGKLSTVSTFVLAALFCATSVHAAEKATFGYSSADAGNAPLLYAQDKGLFAKYGLDGQVVFLDSGAKGVQSLIGGAIDILEGDGAAIVNARLSGVEIRAITVSVGVLVGKVMVAKDITSAQDLKGKKWGISSFGSEAQMAEKLFLKANGLAETDVTEIQLGNQGNRFAALEANQISASTFLPPIIARVEAAGYKPLAELPKLAPEYYSTGGATMLSTIQKRPALVKAFIQAVSEADALMKKDKAGSVEVIKKHFKASDDEATFAWDYYAPIYAMPPRVTPKSVQFHLEESKDPAAKKLKPSDVIDNSILDQLEKDGFFKTLN